MNHASNELGPCIRRADVTDCSDIVELINAASGIEGQLCLSGHHASLADIQRLHGRGYFLVLDRARGGLAAAIYVEMRSRRGHCTLLFVAPECQGHDLSRRLVEVAEAMCQAEGCTAMVIEVAIEDDDDTSEVQSWYRSLGYCECRTWSSRRTSPSASPSANEVSNRRISVTKALA